MKDLTVVELKALAYDNLAQIEQCQQNIKNINKAIMEKSNEPIKTTGDSGKPEEEAKG